MKNPESPATGPEDTGSEIIGSALKNVFEQVKNAPGRDFRSFDPAASFISPEYRKLNDKERLKLWQAVLLSRESNADLDNGGEIIYWFDENNGGRLQAGNLYRIFRTEKKETEKLLLWAPLRILYAVKTDVELKIKYEFAGKESIAPIRELVAQLSINMRSTHDANKTLSELLYKYIEDQNKNGKIVIQHEPIYVENNVIRVSFDTSTIDAGKVLKILRDFHPVSSNPHAFLSGLAYNLIAPLAYFIRKKAPFGYLYPIRISYGRTGGSKTTTDSIFVLNGYAQTKEMGVLTNEQVATPFTFQKNMQSGMLPVIINDVASDWLSKVSTVLKNSSENPISGDRGNPDQSVTRREIWRAINITMNDIFVRSDDAAQTRRYILEEYREEHVKRRNPSAFRDFMDSLPDGYMFALFREIFDGTHVDGITKDIAKNEDACAFVNYGLGLINRLCEKYGTEKFPVYTASTNYAADSFSELVEWLEAQWFRLNQTDDNGRLIAPYPEVSRSEIDVDEMSNFRVIWFTGAAYRVAQRRLNLPHRTVSALFSNYVENPQIQIASANKFHKFAGVAGRGFALRVLKEDVTL